MVVSFFGLFAAQYEALFPYREAVGAFLLRQAGEGGRALDIGCGTGHYAGRLAAAGLAAVGIDVEPEMTAAAAARYPQARFRTLDMRRIDELATGPQAEAPFDMAFCIGNTAAHLAQTDWPDLLARLRRVLRPGGRWIVQVVNWDFVLSHPEYRFPPRRMPAPEGGEYVFHRAYVEVTPERLRFRTRLELDGRLLFAGEETLHPVTAEASRRLHAQAGFALEAEMADYDGRPLDPAREGGRISVFTLA